MANPTSALSYSERPAGGQAEGLLLLHHGRGTDDRDLLPLADAVDPVRRLHVVTPRAPLPYLDGYRWYETPRVGHPDPETFRASQAALASLHDELWQRTGLGADRTVLGGFSMGAVMSYGLGLDGPRPAPAGILALSGFLPTVPGWEPSLADRAAAGTRFLIAHGRHDPVISVDFARQAREQLTAVGLEPGYHEFDGYHEVPPAVIPIIGDWLATVLRP